MRIRVVEIQDRGIANRERLHIAVDTTVSLYHYVVYTSTSPDKRQVSAGGHLAYWFPGHEVGPGDNVFLYTAYGYDKVEKNNSGGHDYFFYWNNPQTLWASEDTAVVLMEVHAWESFPPDTPETPAASPASTSAKPTRLP